MRVGNVIIAENQKGNQMKNLINISLEIGTGIALLGAIVVWAIFFSIL